MTKRERLRGTHPTLAERACLYLLQAKGATYASVAWQLGISPSTVKTHLGKLYARLDVDSAAQAIGELSAMARLGSPERARFVRDPYPKGVAASG